MLRLSGPQFIVEQVLALQFLPPAPIQHCGFYVFYDLHKQLCIVFGFITACLNSLTVKRKLKYIYVCMKSYFIKVEFFFSSVTGYLVVILIVELVFRFINYMFLNEFRYWSLIYCLYSLTVLHSPKHCVATPFTFSDIILEGARATSYSANPAIQ